LFSDSGVAAALGNNVYLNASSQYIYQRTDLATNYQQYQGAHVWSTAASGTAGNAITFTQAMTLDASGNLGVGETSLTERITAKKNGAAEYCTIQAKNANSTATLNIGVGGSTVGNTPLQNNAYVINAGNSALVFGTNDTERARFNSTGALVFVGGTTTADGIGITFPATQSASTNANTLDDYEEGTWTPSFTGSTTDPTVVYGEQVGLYTKIGNIVYFALRLSTTTAVGGSGDLRISGLPFTTAATNNPGPTTVNFSYQFATANPQAAALVASVNYFILQTTISSNTNATVANLTGTGAVFFTCGGFYKVA